ncbi:hypothetical protein D3C72_1538120 [compost metagenome]
MVQLDEAFALIQRDLDRPEVQAVIGVVVGLRQTAPIAQQARAGAAHLDVGLVLVFLGVLVHGHAVGHPFGALVAQHHFGQHGFSQVGAECVCGLGQHVQFGGTEMGQGSRGSSGGGHEGFLGAMKPRRHGRYVKSDAIVSRTALQCIGRLDDEGDGAVRMTLAAEFRARRYPDGILRRDGRAASGTAISSMPDAPLHLPVAPVRYCLFYDAR